MEKQIQQKLEEKKHLQFQQGNLKAANGYHFIWVAQFPKGVFV